MGVATGIELSIFIILAFATLFAGIASLWLLLRIIKNRKKSGLFSAFFLNQDKAKKTLRLYYFATIPLFLTGVFTLIQKYLAYYTNLQILNDIFFVLAYIFGITGALLLSIVIIKVVQVLGVYMSGPKTSNNEGVDQKGG